MEHMNRASAISAMEDHCASIPDEADRGDVAGAVEYWHTLSDQQLAWQVEDVLNKTVVITS